MTHQLTASEDCYKFNSHCLLRAEHIRRKNGDAYLKLGPEYDSPEFHAAGFTWEGVCQCNVHQMQSDGLANQIDEECEYGELIPLGYSSIGPYYK